MPAIAQRLRDIAPGFLLSLAIAVAAALLAPQVARIFPIPPIILALIIGILLNGLAAKSLFIPGLTFCVKVMLRWAVALLGLRISLGEIVALGLSSAFLIIVAMVATVASGFLFARFLGQNKAYGALAGMGSAVCGASATLATSTVLPDYKGKEADIAFVVVAVNTLSTFAMVLYPVLCTWLGFDPQTTGIMLGGTIHDVAQVAGAGYAISEPVGNTAIVVKLFRVLMLLPMIVGISFWFSRDPANAKTVAPVFAFVFILLCLLNSAMAMFPQIMPLYVPVKSALIELSNWGLLVAIAALGLGTSFGALGRLGLKHIATVTGTTLVILIAVTAGLFVLR